MPIKGNQVADLGNGKIARPQAPETEIIADTPAPRIEEQILLPSQIRGPAAIRDLSVPLVGEPISESTGERLGDVISVGT